MLEPWRREQGDKRKILRNKACLFDLGQRHWQGGVSFKPSPYSA